MMSDNILTTQDDGDTPACFREGSTLEHLLFTEDIADDADCAAYTDMVSAPRFDEKLIKEALALCVPRKVRLPGCACMMNPAHR